MARKTKEQKLQEIHETAKAEFDASISASQDEREQALQDRRFYSVPGAQWEGVIGEQFRNRVMMEVNKVHLAVIRIFNEYRNNRITAVFSDKSGNKNDELSELCSDLYRADEQDSQAEEAMDNAFEEGTGGGFGAWRLTTEYEDEYDDESDEQRVRFQPIYDADSCVYFDANAKLQDKSDAKRCWVLEPWSRTAYEEAYPNDDPSSWPRPVSDAEFDWTGPDLVYVADYYVIEETTEDVHTYRTISGDEIRVRDADLDDETIAKYRDTGTIRIKTKPVKRKRVHKYIMSGGGILEDCGYIAGTEIPIVPFYGKRWFVDGQERFMGHVRLVKDPQRLKNMQISELAEKAAEGGERTPIMAPEQVAGLENVWKNKAVDRPAYLLLNPITNADGDQVFQGPMGYTEEPTVSQAMSALMQLAEADMDDILGNQGGGEEIQSNLSGRAVELIQSRLDGQTFIYMSNMAKAVRRSGQIWLGMARDVYDETGRKMKAVNEQGDVDYVDIGKSVIGPDGKPTREADITSAKMDITVDIGPTSRTKKQAVVNSLVNMLQFVTDPADQAVISAMILRNMEGEGIGPMREYFRQKLIQLGVEEPTEAEMEEMERALANAGPQQPDPQAIYLQTESEKNMAEAEKARAQTGKTIADTELSQAKTAETLAGIDREDRQQAIEGAEKIAGAVRSGTVTPQVTSNTGPRPANVR